MTPDRPDIAVHLHKIRELHAELARSRAEYDFQAPALASHAEVYASDPPRLRRYAITTINARIMQFLAVTFMKTYHFLDAYLYGVDKRNRSRPSARTDRSLRSTRLLGTLSRLCGGTPVAMLPASPTGSRPSMKR